MAKKPPKKPKARCLEIYAAVCDGKLTQAQIGAKYGVTQQYVSKVAGEVEEWHRPQLAGDIATIKKVQTRALMVIFSEAMDAWEKSKRDARLVRVKEGGEKVTESGEGVVMETETTRERKNQSGDPRYLQAAMSAFESIRKIWGADAPLETKDVTQINDPRELVNRLKERMASLAGGKTKEN